MESRFKVLLTVNEEKHKLSFDSFGFKDSVPFSSFKAEMLKKYPQFSYIFDETIIILEVFDEDFSEYIKLETNDCVENKSRLRVKVHPSIDSSSQQESHILSNLSADFTNITFPSETTTKHSTTTFVTCESSNEAKASPFTLSTDHCSSMPCESSLPEKAKKMRKRQKRQTSKSSAGSVNSTKSEKNVVEEKFLSEVGDHSISSHADSNIRQSLLKIPAIDLNFGASHVNTDKMNCTLKKDNSVSFQKPYNSSVQVHSNSSRQRSVKKKPNLKITTDKGKVIFEEFGKVRLYESDFAINHLSYSFALCETICEYNRGFCESEDAWNADNVWEAVVQRLSEVSKIRASISDVKELFSCFLCQYTKIIMYLIDWTEDDCKKLWPLFPLFHYEILLIPFRSDIERLIRNFDSHSKTSSKFCLRSFASKETVDENFSIFDILKGKKISPRKDRVNEDPFDDDFELLEAVKKHQLEFRNNRKVVSVVWDKIQYEVNKRSKKCLTALGCRQQFELLLNKYVTMLTSMKDFTFDKCCKLWPLFEYLHCDIDFSLINKKILTLKNEFDESEKIEDEENSTDSDETDVIEDETEIELKLVVSIGSHLGSLINKEISEDDFWQKIAYDLSFYDTPVENSSKSRWQLMLCSIVDKYMRGDSQLKQLNDNLQQILERIYNVTSEG